MGLFNKNIFKELEDGIKNLEKNIKSNLEESNLGDNKENSMTIKCKGCGANIEASSSQQNIKCKYCGLINNNEQYKKSVSSIFKQNDNTDYQTKKIKYPILVMLDEESGFSGFDCQTEYETDCYNSVEEVLADIKKQLEEISADMVNEGDEFESWTEQTLMQKKSCQKLINKGAKIKYIELNCALPKNFQDDPNW